MDGHLPSCKIALSMRKKRTSWDMREKPQWMSKLDE